MSMARVVIMAVVLARTRSRAGRCSPDRVVAVVSAAGIAPFEAVGLDWLVTHCPTTQLRIAPEEGHISVRNGAPQALDRLRHAAD